MNETLKAAYEAARALANSLPPTISVFVDGRVILQPNIARIDALDAADEAYLDWVEQDEDQREVHLQTVRNNVDTVDARTKRRLKIQARHQLLEHIVVGEL